MFVLKVPARNANQPRWFTSIIQHKVKCLHTLRRRYEKHPTELNKSKDDKTAIELQLVMTKAKSNYESNLILKFAHTHHNNIYQYISSIKGQDNFPTQMFYNNQHACNDQEKAQLFNNYFYSVFSTDSITPVNELQVLAHYMTLKSMNPKYSLYLALWMAIKHLALTILASGYTDTVLYHYSNQFVICLQLVCPLVVSHLNSVLTGLHIFTNLVINP